MRSPTTTADALRALDQYMVEHDYAGPDPYDGLTSPISRFTHQKLAKQVVIQAVKRSPVELRKLLRIPPIRMSKTLGLVSASLHQANWLPDSNARALGIVQELLTRQNRDGAWGYEFDVQMRWGAYNRGMSNIVATTFAVEGIHPFGSLVSRPNWQSSVSRWINENLGRHGFISYVANNDALIHNANLLGAMCLYRCVSDHPLIASSIDRSLSQQKSDGSWPYGERSQITWIDSFHTAYVLWALYELQDVDASVTPAFERGLDFWLQECFTPGGHPKYYASDTEATLDVHTCSTAIFLLSRVLPNYPSVREILDRLVLTTVQRMNVDGTVTTRKFGRPYMRWELAHLHRALSEYLSKTTSKNETQKAD